MSSWRETPTISNNIDAQRVIQADLVVDAILGTGFRPPVKGFYASVIEAINAAPRPVIAVDIPSGADADSLGEVNGLVAKADAVVTFTAPRPAHVFASLTTGPSLCAAIGSPDEAIISALKMHVSTAQDFAELLSARPPDSNKGNFGHVLLVGGSLGKAGAAAMAGFSVLRSGAGLSTVATPKSAVIDSCKLSSGAHDRTACRDGGRNDMHPSIRGGWIRY